MRIIKVRNGEVVEVGNSSAPAPRQSNQSKSERIQHTAKGTARATAKSRGAEVFEEAQDLQSWFGETDQHAVESQSDRATTGRRRVQKEKGGYEDVYGRAIYLLSMRDHSRHELFTKLSRKFPSSEHINGVIDALVEQRFLDDARFIEAYLRMRMARGIGPLKVSVELRNKGVEDQLINDWVVFEDEAWKQGARNAYDKKFGGSAIADFKEWTKRARFLQSRGFSRQHIDAVLPEY